MEVDRNNEEYGMVSKVVELVSNINLIHIGEDYISGDLETDHMLICERYAEYGGYDSVSEYVDAYRNKFTKAKKSFLQEFGSIRKNTEGLGIDENFLDRIGEGDREILEDTEDKLLMRRIYIPQKNEEARVKMREIYQEITDLDLELEKIIEDAI